MIYLYFYLIGGFLCAIWNDIVIASNITKRHFIDKSNLCKFAARFSVFCFVIIFWIPILFYMFFSMKDYER